MYNPKVTIKIKVKASSIYDSPQLDYEQEVDPHNIPKKGDEYYGLMVDGGGYGNSKVVKSRLNSDDPANPVWEIELERL